MPIPSIRTIKTRLNVSDEVATRVRAIMESYRSLFPFSNPAPITTLGKISDLVGGFGYEVIPKGSNANSPTIHYVNMGDTYSPTVLFVRGKFRIGDWGAIVERGNYA